MNIIVIGTNQLAHRLANFLAPYHDVCVVGSNRNALQKIAHQADVKTFVGEPALPTTLRQAGAEKCDCLIAVHNRDEVNMVACQVGFSLFAIKLKIALITSDHYLVRQELFGNADLPIDLFINPEQILLQQILATCQIPVAQTTPIINTPFFLVDLAAHFKLTSQIASHAEQQTQFICPQPELPDLASHLTPEHNHYKRVMISGTSPIAIEAATQLSQFFAVKVIEADLGQCEQLASRAPNLVVLNGEPFDEHLLMEEAIDECDLFLALSYDDENNVMAGLQAKRLGARFVMTLVNHHSYNRILSQLPQIDHVLSSENFALSQIRWAISVSPHQWLGVEEGQMPVLFFETPAITTLEKTGLEKMLHQSSHITLWHLGQSINKLAHTTPLRPQEAYAIAFESSEMVKRWQSFFHNLHLIRA